MEAYSNKELMVMEKKELINIIRVRGKEIKAQIEDLELLRILLNKAKEASSASEDELAKTITRGVFQALGMDNLVRHLDRLRFSKSEAIRLIIHIISAQRDELANMHRLWENEQRKRSQKEMFKSFKSKDKPTKHEMYLEAMKGRRSGLDVC